jgi:hypothetical protein
MANPLVSAGVLKYTYEVEIAGEIHPLWGFPQINRDLSNISATTIIPNIGPWPSYAYDLAPLVVRMALNSNTLKTMFRGVVSHHGLKDHTPEGNINGIDLLYLAQIPSPVERVWRAKYSHEIIADLLELSGITDYVIEETGWLMGTVEPIVLRKEQTPYSLIRDIDIAENCRTMSHPSGQIIRRQLPLYPGAAGSVRWKYASPQDIGAGELWITAAAVSESPFFTIKNRVVVEGITLPGVREQIDTLQGSAVSLGYVPDDGSVAVTSLDGSLSYVEDTDFEIDYTLGTFTSLGGGAIADGDDVIVSYNTGARRKSDTVTATAVVQQLTFVPLSGSVVVTGDAPGEVVYVEDTDFEIDYEAGTITGISLAYNTEVTATVEYSHAVSVSSSPIRIVQKASHSSLPPGRYQTENVPINAALIQDPYRAALIAIMWLKNLNRTTLTLSLTGPTNLDMLIGDGLSYEDIEVNLPTATPFLVVGYSINGPDMSIRGVGGQGGEIGTLEPYAPFASFDWRALAVGDFVLLTLFSTSMDLNDDIVAYDWNADGYQSDSMIFMVFDTTEDEFFTASLQVKDATDLESNIYARGIDLLGSQEDIDSGRYRALTILQIDEGIAALVMSGHREFVGPGSEDVGVQGALIDTGGPYFSYTQRYLGPGRAVLLPRWNELEERFSGAHTFNLGGLFDIPVRYYISTLYGGDPYTAEGDGKSFLPEETGWFDYASDNGLGGSPFWVWQHWDAAVAGVVSVADGVIGDALSKRPGVYVQIFPMTPLEDTEMPPWSNETYFRYENVGEGRGAAAITIFPINPLFMTLPVTVIPFPDNAVLKSAYSDAYEEAYGMPESSLGQATFLTDYPRETARDVYVEVDDAFPGQPIWISPEGTVWLALMGGIYISHDQGVTWNSYFGWADTYFAGDYTMDGEGSPVYRYGYKWGAVAGSGSFIAACITGWSVARDSEADPWYDFHTEATFAQVYKGHREPLVILPSGATPTFPEDIEVRDIIGLPDEVGFVVNGTWMVLYDEDAESWSVTEITYTHPIEIPPPDLLGTRFTPHPSEPSIFLVSEVNGDYWAYRRTEPDGAPTALTLLGKRDSPIPGGGSYLAVTNQSTIPILPVTLVSQDDTTKSTKATVEPGGYRDLLYADSWWVASREIGA